MDRSNQSQGSAGYRSTRSQDATSTAPTEGSIEYQIQRNNPELATYPYLDALSSGYAPYYAEISQPSQVAGHQVSQQYPGRKSAGIRHQGFSNDNYSNANSSVMTQGYHVPVTNVDAHGSITWGSRFIEPHPETYDWQSRIDPRLTQTVPTTVVTPASQQHVVDNTFGYQPRDFAPSSSHGFEPSSVNRYMFQPLWQPTPAPPSTGYSSVVNTNFASPDQQRTYGPNMILNTQHSMDPQRSTVPHSAQIKSERQSPGSIVHVALPTAPAASRPVPESRPLRPKPDTDHLEVPVPFPAPLLPRNAQQSTPGVIRTSPRLAQRSRAALSEQFKGVLDKPGQACSDPLCSEEHAAHWPISGNLEVQRCARTCEVCGQTLGTNGSLRRHVRTKHCMDSKNAKTRKLYDDVLMANGTPYKSVTHSRPSVASPSP